VIFTPLFLVLLLAGVLPAALASRAPEFVVLGVAYDFLLIAAAIADFALVPGPRALPCSRQVAEQLSLGVSNPVRIKIFNPGPFWLSARLRDEAPVQFETSGHTANLRLPPRTETIYTYQVTPNRRGDYAFGDLNLRLGGPLGLVIRQIRVAQACAVKVYPNLRQVKEFDLMARRGRLSEAGVHWTRMRGHGTAFESLRDYQPDDDYRRIDWKATARRAKLIVQDYETERSQNVLLLLDLGRLMTGEHQGMSKLDYAVNAALMLAYVAALNGDRVGLLCFSSTVESYQPPKRGKQQVLRILAQLYAVQPKLVEPDYALALQYLSLHARKRALIIVLTDVVDTHVSAELVVRLRALAPAHLPLCVTMRDASLAALAEQEPRDLDKAFQRALAVKTLAEREEALAQLRNGGVLVLDTRPEDLSVSLVNRYLQVKARSLL